MSGVAVLFPGQGVQHEGMLPWLDQAPAAAPLMAALRAAIGADWRRQLGDAEWSERNHIAQPLIAGLSLAAWAVLREAGLPAPAACAGYSVGELAAFSAAGVYPPLDAIALARQRAEAMDEAAEYQPGRLVAVAGASPALVERACARWPLEVAIRIAPDRCLLGGPEAAILEATPFLAAAGADVTPLRIRVASHTTAMRAAAARLAAVIAPLAWTRPRGVLVANLEGQAVRTVAEAQRCLAGQIDHTVQWQACMQTLAERRPTCVLEIGPGSSLTRFWQAAHPAIPARALEDFAEPAGAVAWVQAQL